MVVNTLFNHFWHNTYYRDWSVIRNKIPDTLLWIGKTLANFQEVGTLACARFELDKVTREGANSLAYCFNTADYTPFGPHASL